MQVKSADSLGSQSQPERGSRLPLVYCGWIPSSRDFGFLVDRVACATLALPIWICAMRCVCVPCGLSTLLYRLLMLSSRTSHVDVPRCSTKLCLFLLVFSFSVAAATSFFLGECRHCCCDGGCFGLGPSAPGDLFSSPHRRRPSPNTPLPSSLFSS